jgi:hypothetical protein
MFLFNVLKICFHRLLKKHLHHDKPYCISFARQKRKKKKEKKKICALWEWVCLHPKLHGPKYINFTYIAREIGKYTNRKIAGKIIIKSWQPTDHTQVQSELNQWIDI